MKIKFRLRGASEGILGTEWKLNKLSEYVKKTCNFEKSK